MQLYLQSAVVERGIGPEDLDPERAEVVTGLDLREPRRDASSSSRPAPRSTSTEITRSDSAADAAKALAPFAGRYAEVLFAVGLLGASLLAAAILPVTAAYVVCGDVRVREGNLAQAAGSSRVRRRDHALLIVIGTAVALIPGLPVISLLVSCRSSTACCCRSRSSSSGSGLEQGADGQLRQHPHLQRARGRAPCWPPRRSRCCCSSSRSARSPASEPAVRRTHMGPGLPSPHGREARGLRRRRDRHHAARLGARAASRPRSASASSTSSRCCPWRLPGAPTGRCRWPSRACSPSTSSSCRRRTRSRCATRRTGSRWPCTP